MRNNQSLDAASPNAAVVTHDDDPHQIEDEIHDRDGDDRRTRADQDNQGPGPSQFRTQRQPERTYQHGEVRQPNHRVRGAQPEAQHHGAAAERADPLKQGFDAVRIRAMERVEAERRVLELGRLPLAGNQDRQRTGLDEKHRERAAGGHDDDRHEEAGQRDRRAAQRRHNLGCGGPDTVREDRPHAPAGQQRHHQRAADHGHGQRQFVERFDRELDQNDGPVGERDQRAARERSSQRKRDRHAESGGSRPRDRV